MLVDDRDALGVHGDDEGVAELAQGHNGEKTLSVPVLVLVPVRAVPGASCWCVGCVSRSPDAKGADDVRHRLRQRLG
jgi:hypothetical protein